MYKKIISVIFTFIILTCCLGNTIIKNKEEKINKFIDEYSISVKFFMTNKKLLFKTTALTVIQLTAYFSVSMAVSPIPTPGNIGANEIAFFSIFNGVFQKSILGYAVLLYGALVYYFILITSAILTLLTHAQIKEKPTVADNSNVSKI